MLDFLDDIPTGQKGLRYYQRDAVEAIKQSLTEHRSCGCIMATGTGKTEVAVTLINEWPGNVLWLAHRDELVQQARNRLEEITGEWIDVEQSWSRANKARIVVGSVQTVQRDNRLEALGKDRFALIIVDELHHYVARTYKKPLDYFENAQLVGLTATPDRADKKALGKIIEEVPPKCVFNLLDAINAGYLVPLEMYRVHLDEVDLRNVCKSKGDLQSGELDTVMVKAVEGICKKTLDQGKDRRGICFFPGVKSAELAMQRFNALRPNSAIMISAKTNPDLRRELVDEWKSGQYQYFCNVQIATEGFDSPDVSLIVQGRPTLSRALYSQMIGRGTRILPDLVEELPGPSMAEERRSMIQASDKQNCLVLDFVGNCGKHQIVTPVDIFSGSYTEPEIKLAKKKAKKEGGDPVAFLEMARQELKELAERLESEVKARIEKYDPFKGLGPIGDDRYVRSFGYKPPSVNQRRLLERFGIDRQVLGKLSQGQAGKLLDSQFKRLKAGFATHKQMLTLGRYGITDPKITKKQASNALDYLKKCDWGRKPIDNGYLDEILHRMREPGEEGP
jgi:superfamily II DNA or RNA helicase